MQNTQNVAQYFGLRFALMKQRRILPGTPSFAQRRLAGKVQNATVWGTHVAEIGQCP
jgi:hypothetical protein